MPPSTTDTIKISANKSGAALVRHALENLPISHTFGIPGVHNTEIYDELNNSQKISPILVTHESGASFIGDAISRSNKEEIGCCLIVPAAGVTHAMSGIGEAFVDGIPLLILSGGTRTDVPFAYQVHEMDQISLLKNITKSARRITTHEEIIPAIYDAYHTAISGTPGPTVVEIPADIQLKRKYIDTIPAFTPPTLPELQDPAAITTAAQMLSAAKHPGIFVGWGAVDVVEEVQQIADILAAPVATTLQGLSAFPATHPLHAGMGFGPAAIPAATNAFQGCDCLLAIGTKFSEIATGSYSTPIPENLIHIDIANEVIGRSYPAKIGITADSRVAVPSLLQELKKLKTDRETPRAQIANQIANDKKAYLDEWFAHTNDRVNPALLLRELRAQLKDDAITVVDDGNHTFLAAELFPVLKSRSFISPTDFNCMGYCVPAAIGAKLVNPDKQVVGIVGDGAFIMTGFEILTATAQNVGVAYFVFHDGELSQISQGQQIPYNRKTCTIMGNIKFKGIAEATGAHFIAIDNNTQIAHGIREALETTAKGQPVIVDVRIDYSKRTRFTQGVVNALFRRFPLGDKFRFIGRALYRRITG